MTLIKKDKQQTIDSINLKVDLNEKNDSTIWASYNYLYCFM